MGELRRCALQVPCPACPSPSGFGKLAMSRGKVAGWLSEDGTKGLQAAKDRIDSWKRETQLMERRT